MSKSLLIGVLVFTFMLELSVVGAPSERLQPSFPDELAEAWEKLQRALQDWSRQLRERFETRGPGEDRPLISLMLSYKDDLRLTPEQVKKLEQLRDDFQRRSIRNDADTRILELDIAELLDRPKVDVAKVEAKIREVERLRADLRIARVRAIEQAKAVLNAEQRRKFYETIEQRPARTSNGGQSPAKE